jgi:hypothetical protein
MFTVGVPSASLGPATAKKYKELTALTEIAVPVRGGYPEDFSKKGTYDICPEEGVFLFGLLTEVMLAHRVYPALEEKQSFVIAGFDLHDDVITMVGRVVEEVEE